MLTEDSILGHLREIGLPLGDDAACFLAGDGNINWVRRVRSGDRSWIVKQAGPTLAKFPEYAADPGRILHEARYFASVAPLDPDGVCPAVHHLDPAHHLLVLEDLGEVERFDAALDAGAALRPAVERMARFLGTVHAGTLDAPLLDAFPDGQSGEGVLALHLAHIFELPFAENDFPLSTAVSAAGSHLREDDAFRTRLSEIDKLCRQRGRALIHGDVQPTNLLLADGGVRLLDPEMAHAGHPAFDLGLFFAHLWIDGIARDAVSAAEATVRAGWGAYTEAAGPAAPGFEVVAAVAGVEMLRRTLGAARVPAVERDEVALAVIGAGRAKIVEPPSAP